LDVVPDNIATIDNAFVNRSMAEKFLFTCYSYMPAHASLASQSFLIADEFWGPYPVSQYLNYATFEQIGRGNQSVVSPCMNYWNGLVGGKPMFIALRDCNIFLERLNGDVPGLPEIEKNRWIAEAKFLKAYYHYWLLRMYGPIPLIRENLPVSASVEEVQVYREPVDECFDYIVSLLDEAVAYLPLKIDREATEMGRATQPIALAVKAKVLVEAASPLFNGNTDYANFKRKDDVLYFNQRWEVSKWEKAAIACRDAIDACEEDFALYYFEPGITENLPPEMITQMSIRNSVTEGNYTLNNEVVWSNPNSMPTDLQQKCTPNVDKRFENYFELHSILVPPLKTAEMFYTSNGIPMNEDDEWVSSGKYAERYHVKTATEADKYNILVDYQTAGLHFDREARFYANLAFDGNLWYGLNNFNAESQWVIRSKFGQYSGKINLQQFSVTGYFCKKLVYYRNVILENTYGYTMINYNWPVIRLADLYLLYSEALNEANGGPTEEAYHWIDEVRKRAGLEGVVASWAKASPAFQDKPATQNGFREIVQRERLIELAHEGHRYWEIRRWKRAKEEWHNQPIQGWDVDQSDTETYNRVRNIFVPQFTTKNYFWPIREQDLTVNPNLDQNPGW